jgi:hypothetical protein
MRQNVRPFRGQHRDPKEMWEQYEVKECLQLAWDNQEGFEIIRK